MIIRTEPNLLRRSLAFIIDFTLWCVFYFWFLYAFGAPDAEGNYEIKNDPILLVPVLVYVVLFPAAEAFAGQTLGKRLLNLKVVTKNGNPVSFWQAVGRHLVDFLDFFAFGLVAIIAIKYTQDHQRLGDLVANTLVIRPNTTQCSQCKEFVELDADEMGRREFVCPVCNTLNRI